ncbi:hypothetical protein RUM43_012021 [Polyplax serrata]|uniref:Uncharacterized protein n=1 Tax=Polyplax serrata TaxID=468196 RepID=A0AAN8RZL7_POLSC
MCDKSVDSPAIMAINDTGENLNSLNLSHEEKDIIIRQLSQEVEDLKHLNKELSSERDSLLCEVSKLKFELEMSDLKRLNDER